MVISCTTAAGSSSRGGLEDAGLLWEAVAYGLRHLEPGGCLQEVTFRAGAGVCFVGFLELAWDLVFM